METTQQSGMLTRVERKGEVAVAAMAAKSKAEVEARFAIALNSPRNIMNARSTILDSCKRPAFARGAIYRKPVGGGKTVDGFSIRFAEEAIKSMTNISVDTMTVYEDEDRRTIRISVTDLQTNCTYSDEITISKTVERRQLKEGQVAISERMNSTGQKVFLVAATDDDLINKINAGKSKAIRNSGLRLVPQDILEEAWDQITATMEDPKSAGDPKAETKKICDAFASLNIGPTELERYLKHSLETVSPKELNDLRGIYTAIRDEETSWSAVMEVADPKRPVSATGEPESPGATAGKVAATISQTVIEKPYEHLQGLAKEAGVTEYQIHKFMQSVKLAGEKTEELLQCSDTNLRTVIGTFKDVLGKIKKFPATPQ
jgi:hypothetical protein